MNILHIDDHQLFSDALSLALKARFNNIVYSHCLSVDSGIEFFNHENIDLVLLDFFLDSEQGIEFLRYKINHNKKIPVLIVSSNNDLWKIKSVMDMGAHGYVQKNTGFDTLCEAINIVKKGGYYLSAELSAKIQALEGRNEQCVFERLRLEYQLSKKQIEVLKLVYEGKNNEAIAKLLNRSLNTIKTHVYRSFDILGVDNRMDFMRFINDRN